LPKSKTISNQNDSNPNDIPSTGLNIISFLIPLVGLIIYLIEKDKAPKKANSAGKAALWGIGVSVVFTILLFIISAVMISSMY
jgi:predicted membrane protein